MDDGESEGKKTCYMCRCAIPPESANWSVVETAFCKFLVCETCCDENSGDFEEEDEEDIDMSDMTDALEQTTTQMEDSSSESSSESE